MPNNYWSDLKERLTRVSVDRLPITVKEEDKNAQIVGQMSEDTKRIFFLWQTAKKANKSAEVTIAWMDEEEQVPALSLLSLDEEVLKLLFAAQICSQFPTYFPEHYMVIFPDGKVGYKVKNGNTSTKITR